MEKGRPDCPAIANRIEEVHPGVGVKPAPPVVIQIKYDEPLQVTRKNEESPESGSLYSDEIPSGYNSGEQYDTLSTGYMSGEAYELPETRMAMPQPCLEAIEECYQGLGGVGHSENNLFGLPDPRNSPGSCGMILNSLAMNDDMKITASLTSNSSSSDAAVEEEEAGVEVAPLHHQQQPGIRIGAAKSKLRKKVVTTLVPDDPNELYESSDIGNDGETVIGGYRTVPSDTDTSNVDSDMNAVNVEGGNADLSGAELLRAARNKGRKRSKKSMRNHDEDWFSANDSKAWSIVRLMCFWASILSMLVSTIVSAVLIAMMPRNCDPPVKWYQGNVMMDIRPLSVDALTLLIAELDQYQAMGIKSFHLKYEAAITTEVISTAESLWGRADLTNLTSSLHERNMSLMVQIPIRGSEQDGLIGLKLQHDVEDAVSFWTSIGADGIFLDGLENFSSDPWIGAFLGQLHSLMKRFGRSSVNGYVLMVSYMFAHNLWEHNHDEGKMALNYIDLLDATLEVSEETNVTELSDMVADMAKWDSVDSRPWINWNLNLLHGFPMSNAVLAFQIFLPGTISISGLNSVDSQQLHNMTQLRMVAVPIHMNGNYKRCDCEEGMTKETNYIVLQPINKIVQLERFYNRRNRYVLVANFGQSDESLAIISKIYTGGELVLDTSQKVAELNAQVSFKELTLPPGQAIVIKIPK